MTLILLAGMPMAIAVGQTADRPRARDIGLVVGVFQPGDMNAITDVPGVAVGHSSVVLGDSVRTGVTAVWPHRGNVYERRVPAAIYVANGFGKLIGTSQVAELGELETPVLLTCTLCVWKVADAAVGWLLGQPGMEGVRSINPVVGETNDGRISAIRARPIEPEHVIHALESATTGPVEEGAVGAGAGTVAFGFKGGIGTSSRQLPDRFGAYVVGVLVQSNFGGNLRMNGAPVGRELGHFAFDPEDGDGSIMVVVATDAPVSARQLGRLAKRALSGVVRTGGNMSNGSGDYVVAFSTVTHERGQTVHDSSWMNDDALSPLFAAVAEAAEEAVYNSLLRATTVSSRSGTVEALPVDKVRDILQQYNALDWDERVPGGSTG